MLPAPLPSPSAGNAAQPLPPIRVLLVEDHPITRQGLKALIEQHREFIVCGEADNRASALALTEQAKPDVTVVDITLPATDGLA